jgi:hypothetical protein
MYDPVSMTKIDVVMSYQRHGGYTSATATGFIYIVAMQRALSLLSRQRQDGRSRRAMLRTDHNPGVSDGSPGSALHSSDDSCDLTAPQNDQELKSRRPARESAVDNEASGGEELAGPRAKHFEEAIPGA